MSTPLLASTLADEGANLKAIAAELADRPELSQWAQSNADIASHVGAIHNLYPWLPPGVTLALGTARYAPDDPFVKTLADQVMSLGRKSSPQVAAAGVEQAFAPGIAGVSLHNSGGFFDRVVHDAENVVTKPMELLGHAVTAPMPEPMRAGIKDVSRFGMGFLHGGLETVVAGVRQIQAVHQANPALGAESYGLEHGPLGGGGFHPNTISTHVAPLLPQLTIAQMINGKGSGSGFFPSGAANEAATKAQQFAGSITGPDGQAHALTFGRGIAGSILPANSKAYGVVSGLSDAAFDWYADPAAYALKGVGELRAAHAAVAAEGTHWGPEGGMLDRLRQVIGPQTAAEHLDSNVGQGIINKLTTLDTSRSVMHFMGNKIDPSIAAELADAHTPEAVRAVLDHELGTGIQTLPTFHPLMQKITSRTVTDDFGNPLPSGTGSLGYTVDRAVRNSRFAAAVPSGWFPTDLSQSWTRSEAYRQAENFLRNAKVPAGDMDSILDRVATASNRNQMYDAWKQMLTITSDHLVRDAGLDPALARQLTHASGLSDELTDTAQHFRTSLEDKYQVPGVLVGGKPVHFDGALPTELLQSNLPMPDYREIRRATSMVSKVLRAAPGGTALLSAKDLATATLDAATHLWKGMQLLRPAFVARVGGEAQLATAAAGDANAFTHPFEFMSWAIGSESPELTNAKAAQEALRVGRLDEGTVAAISNSERAEKALADAVKAGVEGRPLAVLRKAAKGAMPARVEAETRLASLEQAAKDATTIGTRAEARIAARVGRKGTIDILGNELGPLDYGQVFRTAPHVSGIDPARVYASQWRQILRTDPGFIDAWAQEVRHMSLDELGSATARAVTGDAGGAKGIWHAADGDREVTIERSLGLGSDGREYVTIAGSATGVPIDQIDLAQRGARSVDELKQAFFDGHLRSLRLNMLENDPSHWQSYLGQRSVSDAYIDMQVQRIRTYAQDDPELLQAMASGKFRGEALAQVSEKTGRQIIGSAADRAPQSLRDRLAELHGAGVTPDYMKGYLYGKARLGASNTIEHMFDKAATRGFKMLNTASLRELTASSTFRQEYYKAIDDLLPHMDPGEAATAVANAEKAGVHGLDAAKAVGSLDAQTANMIAKSRALDQMSTILHDLGHRSQLSDMLRFVFPFGDAYQKVLSRWAKLVSENPATVERLRQGVMGAEGSSFVHTDPQSGKLVVTVPLSVQIDQLIAGVPFPMSAPLNGLSIVGSGLPGVGPAVSIPMAAVAAHVPQVQSVVDKLVPYGAPNTKQGFLEAFLPAWFQKWRGAGLTGPIGASADQQSTFAHSVGEVLRWGVSTGKYKVDTPAHITAAVADARHKAKMLAFIRGAVQSTFPSPPSIDYMVKDKNGRMLNAYLLTNELQNLYNGKGVDGKSKNDPAQAAQIFLKLHGDQNYLELQAFTTPRRYGLPTTTDAAKWLAAHGSFQHNYPNVYGVLTPQKGAFDYSTYLNQLHSGDRVDRSPQDFVELGNARIAAMIYDTERNKLPDDASSADKANYLAQLKAWLKAKYPGYGAQELNVEKATIPDAINELSKAAVDPAVAKGDAAVATREYLQLRQQVIDFEKANGSTVHQNALSNAPEFQPQAEWLSAQASQLISRYPTFFPVWDQLLSHEVTLQQPNPAGT